MTTTGTITPDIEALPFKTVVTFRSKNANDATLWTGTLISRGIYESYDDDGSVQPYNEAVRQSDPTVSSDYTTLTFFELRIQNNGTTRQALFAKEWLADGSLTVLSQTAQETVIVTDPYADSQRLLNYLRSGGYTAKLSS